MSYCDCNILDIEYTILNAFTWNRDMIHIIPLNDIKEHEEATTCDCCPSVEFENGEMIVIHNEFEE